MTRTDGTPTVPAASHSSESGSGNAGTTTERARTAGLQHYRGIDTCYRGAKTGGITAPVGRGAGGEGEDGRDG